MFIDVHCHLDMIPGIEEAVNNARKKKVLIVTDGVDVKTNRKALEYTKYENVRACLGIYPEYVLEMSDKELKEEIDFILKKKESIIGIGEIGMDFVKNADKKQEKYFRKFIELAMKIDKPVIVHSRKAESECIEILEDMKAKKVVMHCFSGKLKLVERIIKNGWMLSIPTSVKNSEHFQKVIEMAPMGQLLCETDSPYLHPDREFPNTPGNVIESYKMIAKIKKMNLKDVEKKIEGNFKGLFG
ncbi:hypothetical protein CO038_00180 [Candidatus Pacearchaeota archaeon CG_4_9_14_0_2_um_filter_39_13]|nr:TatD family hydrolase [Candidatus Pacearchaeota archaeon]PJC45091.1 MAG: hypothetical protein CO038_00180 [Candidatus Pacearchaeota archaeon CG_4_9_14_0_2_um_filter_39_13]